MSDKQMLLDNPVTVLPGVGPSRKKTLAKLGLFTLRDVLYSFPRMYKDFTKVYDPGDITTEEEYLVYGRLIELSERHLPGNRRLIQGKLLGSRGSLKLTWFVVFRGRGYSYLYRRLQKADHIWIYGQVKMNLLGPEMASAEFYDRAPQHLGLVPVYPLVATITNSMRVKWAKFALKYVNEVYECLPAELLAEYIDRKTALREIHFPTDHAAQEQARKRLVFEEFFLFHLGLQSTIERHQGTAHKPDGQLVESFFERLPFTLTKGQLTAIAEVRKDMEANFQMRRMVQGEVGSGKTMVALYAAVKAVESGGQVAVMVPTEVLARQMADRFHSSLDPLGISVGLLVGNMTAKNQKEVRAKIQDGSLSVVVGTHALITDKVEFKRLSLAVIDEQHRFGVRQRMALSDKKNADLLVMSATPIPRSLALTAYGDLDATIIRELPAGRKSVDTRLIHPSRRNDVYEFVTRRVRAGEQAFVVFPLVEESEKLDLKAAVQEMEKLQKGPLSSVRVGLVHGQMGREKEDVLQAFYRHELDVLVATTVIEVGMDVPTATVIVIENAERFGLAQLHQLRGRVGRGDKPSYCFLIADLVSDTIKERLSVIRNSNDGFVIAEEDLRIRGPGDLLGVRQSGQPWFRLADIIEDRDVLSSAAYEAKKLLSSDPTLKNHPTLQQEISRQRPSS